VKRPGFKGQKILGIMALAGFSFFTILNIFFHICRISRVS